ncbi:MAG: family 43 glycosylhydrolase [Clostridia bacterium]|nr:family 43 glycosylhydrolase [Clostridia bacterium]
MLSLLFTNQKLFNHAKDPAVVKFLGKYFLYYTVKYTEENKIGIGIAASIDMENWQDIGEVDMNMLCEKNGIGAPAAIVLDGRVHLFYQTYGNFENDAICHAISSNGTDFEKNPQNPVFRPDKTWCCGRAIDADVCIFNNKLFLYFATRDHELKIQKVGVAYADINSDFGRSSWKQPVCGAVVCPEMKWEGQCIEAPAAIVNNGEMFMFYGGSYNCTPQQIGCAKSSDGIFFGKIFKQPFIPCGKEGEWNSSESGHPYVFRDDDGRTYLFYQGSSDMGKSWYISKVEIKFDEKNMPYILS